MKKTPSEWAAIEAETGMTRDQVEAWRARAATMGGVMDFMLESIGKLIRAREAQMQGKAAVMLSYMKQLESRISALEARPELAYKGVWSAAEQYAEGDLVTHDGSLFLALRTTSARPGAAPGDFKLVCKRGRDGKDAR